ncbi:alpha/beta hydrolase [Paraburkholderia bryophila]|uniref:Pimeloyl-ACP methyl ester carboxylesterase n=1 Tax=Paraburkholderia bryophila TaxID=420952 RepID=A0A7Y9W5T2_9BURK|nr:alpha/beta hydrolase [Paraburkholderia bryophila]NYH14507.1 pimeloyl-ACP methyl ester carboxylesterase [Paraburkholderia bryophila]
MKPIAFNGCFGWLHEGNTGRGVVLCEPLGHEGMWAHKLVRALAERLSGEGMWVLRFSYPCAGDSAGDDQEDGRFARSIASVRDAMGVLRAHAPIDHLTLLGIRAGATFAMLAAIDEESDAQSRVDALIALAPVVRGRSYLRELSLVQRQWIDTTSPAVQQGHRQQEGMNVLGHRYPADLVDNLKALDLTSVTEKAKVLPESVLLVDMERSDGAALKSVLDSRGVDTAIHGFPEWPTTMTEGTRSRLPLDVIDSLTRWLVERTVTPNVAGTHTARTTACIGHDASVSITANEVTERLVMIGSNQLAGMLSSPARTVSVPPGAPALLIASTASNPRTADGRLAVRLARKAADLGFTTLRVDLCGIGDSGTRAPDDQSGVPYSDPVIDDLAAAADWLAAQGYKEIIAMGVCSGAYAALHAAVRTPSLAGVIAINLARFIWPRGMTLAEAQRQQTNSAKGYLASVRNWRKWGRLVRERRDLRPVLKWLRRLLAARLRLRAAQIAQRFGWQPDANSEQGLLHELDRLGIRTSLIYGEFDPGVDELTRHFGPVHQAFRQLQHVCTHTIRELDHAVYSSSGTHAVIDHCVRILTGWAEQKTPTASDCAASSKKSRKLAASTRISDA